MTTMREAAAPRTHSPRLQGALFQPIGDHGRAELVEQRISEAITGGHLRAGERLPTENDLAQTLGVAPVTVREALMMLRNRGLITTRRGRHGGSFVADSADPVAFALDAVRASSRVSLRDLGAHYDAVTSAAVRLAARRADPSEASALRARLERATHVDLTQWRSAMDDVHVELVALSQSARLTREQMKLQAEFSPFLRLVDNDPDSRAIQVRHLGAMIDAVAAGDVIAAGAASEAFIATAIERLVRLHAESTRERAS